LGKPGPRLDTCGDRQDKRLEGDFCVHHLVRSLAIAALLSSSVAIAQSSSPEPALPVLPVPASDLACPPADAALQAQMAPFTELMLAPGKTISMAEVLKSMPRDAMARMGEMQKKAADQQRTDFANLCRYRAENAAVLASGIRPQVVFMGDSITENWKLADPSYFSARVLDRGIGGQTTPQMLLRFYQDVVELRPRVVHIMAGTNDISANTGPASDAAIVNNVRAMIDIAKANGIRVVLASITPSKGFTMRPNFDPSPRIAAINRQLVRLAAERRVTYVDYFPPLDDGQGGLKAALANDGLHPNRDGYALMRPLTDRAIARAAR
jgi:lysophospholipase L1-like esterase